MHEEYTVLFEKYLKLSNEKSALRDCVISTVHNLYGDKLLNILDIGCGDGSLSTALAKDGNVVSAIDLRDSFLGDGVDFKCVGIFDYSPKKKFDLIIMAYFLWELPLEKWDEVFMKCKNMLNDNGKIFVIDVCNESKFDNVFVEFNLVNDESQQELTYYWDNYCEGKNIKAERVSFKSSITSNNANELYEALSFFFKEPFMEKIYKERKQEFIKFFENKKNENGEISVQTCHSLDILSNMT